MTRSIDQLPRWVLAIFLCALLAPAVGAGTFGTVVPIGGHAADIALDEARGVVYVANFTANRIDIVSLKTRTVQSSLNVSRQPGGLALSPDGRWLVITHLSNFQAPNTATNAVTVLDLSRGNVRQTFTFGNPPLGVAFGADGLALVATTKELTLLDPATGYIRIIETFSTVTAEALPVPSGTPAREVIRASVTASGDGLWIYGTAEVEDSDDKHLIFQYSVNRKTIGSAIWTSSPPMGPRVVSVDRTGSAFLNGWALFHAGGYMLAQFPDALGEFAIGGHAIDASKSTIYAQIAQEAPQQPAQNSFFSTPTASGPARPVLLVADSDNLTIRERLQLAENLSGRAVLSSDGATMYSVSDSGLMILPVGALGSAHRVAAQQEDVVFRGNWCDRRPMTQEITIANPGGGKTDFIVSTSMPGVILSPESATTPAKIRVTIDPNVFQNQQGTIVGEIEISSSAAVNIPPKVRILVNNREPDQRGTFFNVAGKLVDVLADAGRNRLYILRQDRNEVQVYDAGNFRQTHTLRTGNTPMQMTMTHDRQYLIVGADNSQVAHVYNLDTMKFDKHIVFPGGHYPRSIAASGRAILAACRVAGPKHTIDRIQMWGTAVELPTLGIFENDIDENTVLTASPSGSSILVAQADGNVMVYDANSDTFVASRKDFDTLSGAYAALSDEVFVVQDHILNSSLYPVQTLETSTGTTSGFALAGLLGLRTTAQSLTSPGVIQRVDIEQSMSMRATRMTEAPLLPGTPTYEPFTRTLAPLANNEAIVSLTTSGFTVLPWNYDAAVADPRIERVVNAADRTESVAPGGLISILGRDLSPISAAASEVPLPTALADSCITVNGSTLVPVVFVSPTQINAQLPYNVTDTATMVLRTPAGVSNSFKFAVTATAPSVFRTTMEGQLPEETPVVVRATNYEMVTLANPIHGDDWIAIYATGLGATCPAVENGAPGPGDPFAIACSKPDVSLGGFSLPVDWAGLVPGLVGVYQINAYVPFKGIPTGMEVPLTVTQGSYSTTINVRVVK